MKEAASTLKVSMKEVDLDEIEDLHDDMDDLLQDTDEIQEIMGRSFGVPDELDDEELLGELDELEDEIAYEDEQDQVPDYLMNAAQVPTTGPEKEKDVSVDEFGLPMIPMTN